MVSNPITCWSVMPWISTPRGMQCPQRPKSISSVRVLERGVQVVLKTQYATLSEDLIRASARLLGIRAITGAVMERIHTIINTLVEREVLQQQPNGMVRLAQLHSA